MASTVIQFRMENDLKNQFTEVLDKLGLDMPTAFRMFSKKCVAEQGIPFAVQVSEPRHKAETALDIMRRTSERAAKLGIADMRMKEIDAEIAAYRAEK